MRKVYLVGVINDDYSSEEFDVVAVANSEEWAQVLAEAYRIDKGIMSTQMGIREWKVNIHHPIGKIEKREYAYDNTHMIGEIILPYRPIEVKEGAIK